MNSGANNSNQFEGEDRPAAGAGQAARMPLLQRGGAGNGSAALPSITMSPQELREQRKRLRALPAWRRQQIWRLCRIFTWQETNFANGGKPEHAFRGPRRRWAGKTYENGQPVLPGLPAMLRLFLRWQAGGRTPLALLSRWKPPIKIKPADLASFLTAVRFPSVDSFKSARQRMSCPPATASAFWHHLDPAIRRKIIRVFAHRRRATAELRAAQRELDSINVWPKKRIAPK